MHAAIFTLAEIVSIVKKQFESTDERQAVFRPIRRAALSFLLSSALLLGTALAQDDGDEDKVGVCQSSELTDLINNFFQLSVSLGLLGLIVVWQADSLAEMFTLSPEHRERLKRHKRAALKSALILLLIGPLYSLLGSSMGLPLADCITLVPWASG